MDNEMKIAKMYAVIILTGSALVLGKIGKYAYRAYKNKCLELKIARDIIDIQQDVIEEILKEKRKTESK